MRPKTPTPFFPSTHLGTWKGPNRLWMMDPDKPDRSDAQADVSADAVAYSWLYEGAEQTGRLELVGQPHALEAHWTDTFHAAKGMTLHGSLSDARLTLFGTYSAGEHGVWGWRIELDTQDREHFSIRMHNVMPGHDPAPAVIFEGSR